MTGEDTVMNDIENLEGGYGGCYIPGVNNPVATYGNSRYVELVLLGGIPRTLLLCT